MMRFRWRVHLMSLQGNHHAGCCATPADDARIRRRLANLVTIDCECGLKALPEV
jgi:hypothetical protein